MTRRHFLQLAREGDAQAIATLINRNLQPKGIFAVVKYELGYLQICLEGDQMPRQATMMNFLHEGLKRLDVEGVRIVRVYGRRKGKAYFGWHESLVLTENPPSLEQMMVNSENLKKLARQGDYEAIAALLNQELSHKQWNTTVEFKDRCLKINIYGTEAPESITAITLCSRLIAKIRSIFFNRVEIRGYKQEPELLQWLDCFENDDQDMQSKATIPPKTTVPPHKRTNPSGSNTMLLSKIKTWF